MARPGRKPKQRSTGTGAATGTGTDAATATGAATPTATGAGRDDVAATDAATPTGTETGTGAQTAAPSAQSTLFEVEAVATETEEDRRERARRQHRRYRPRADKSEAGKPNPDAQTSAIVLSMLDGLVVSQLGLGAAMQEHERAMIEPPLTRMLGRMTPDQRAAVERYSDPVMMLWGLAVYGSRVYRLAADRAAVADEPAPMDLKPAAEPAPATAARAPIIIGAAPSSGDLGADTAAPADLAALVNGGASLVTL